MVKKKQSEKRRVYQLKITLKGSKPLIWRRILVRGDTTLAKLHDIFQTVMGWTDSHLHQFFIDGVLYGVPDLDYDLDIEDEKRAKLGDFVAKREKIIYEYDFGDGWLHEIVIEKIFPIEKGSHYPVCLQGKRACPPEDCGGIGGYWEFLRAIEDVDHPRHDELLEWAGGEFDAEEFDIEDVNIELSDMG